MIRTHIDRYIGQNKNYGSTTAVGRLTNNRRIGWRRWHRYDYCSRRLHANTH